jgi:outer membrane murein-binding lipoprotein Lpp
MALFSKTDRPTAETLTARIAELEQRRDAIPAELETARGDMTRALATGKDTAKARREAAELTAELEALPESIEALKSELRQAKVDAEADARARERGELVKRLEGLRKSHAAILKAIDDYNTAIDGAGHLHGTHYSAASKELRAGTRPPTERYSVPTVAVVPDLERGAGMILQAFDAETGRRIDAAGKVERERSDVGEGLFFDESQGRYRPLNERPPREPGAPVTIDRKPGADDTGDRIAKKAPGFYEPRK